jgi:hypothetical protein
VQFYFTQRTKEPTMWCPTKHTVCRSNADSTVIIMVKRRFARIAVGSLVRWVKLLQPFVPNQQPPGTQPSPFHWPRANLTLLALCIAKTVPLLPQHVDRNFQLRSCPQVAQWPISHG